MPPYISKNGDARCLLQCSLGDAHKANMLYILLSFPLFFLLLFSQWYHFFPQVHASSDFTFSVEADASVCV